MIGIQTRPHMKTKMIFFKLKCPINFVGNFIGKLSLHESAG